MEAELLKNAAHNQKNAVFVRELKEKTPYNFLIYIIQANYDSITAKTFFLFYIILTCNSS